LEFGHLSCKFVDFCVISHRPYRRQSIIEAAVALYAIGLTDRHARPVITSISELMFTAADYRRMFKNIQIIVMDQISTRPFCHSVQYIYNSACSNGLPTEVDPCIMMS